MAEVSPDDIPEDQQMERLPLIDEKTFKETGFSEYRVTDEPITTYVNFMLETYIPTDFNDHIDQMIESIPQNGRTHTKQDLETQYNSMNTAMIGLVNLLRIESKIKIITRHYNKIWYSIKLQYALIYTLDNLIQGKQYQKQAIIDEKRDQWINFWKYVDELTWLTHGKYITPRQNAIEDSHGLTTVRRQQQITNTQSNIHTYASMSTEHDDSDEEEENSTNLAWAQKLL